MGTLRLLLRISAIEDVSGSRYDGAEHDAVGGIVEHLQRLLNTRQGSVLIAPDYGIPDFSELLHSYPESIKDMERALRLAICKYEPRLSGTRVKFIPDDEDPLNIHFEIVAKLSIRKDAPSIHLESVVDSDGRINIRR